MAAMQRFLSDFPEGLEEGRYLAQSLPHLHFRDDAFDLALCSAFLFTYTEQLTLDFHVAAIEEMCRVASEARIFPLLKSYGGASPHLEPVMDSLSDRGYTATIREVPYEFQRGGNKMLAVTKPGATTVA
jgi:ubiquinone/menaquinone biosynthesis C-methylase UbiE